MTARTLIVRFDVDVVPLAIKHRIEPQACINKSGTQRLSLCFRLHAHAPRLLVRVDTRTIGRVGRVKCGYVGHERNGRQAGAGGHFLPFVLKGSETVSQNPPGAFQPQMDQVRERKMPYPEPPIHSMEDGTRKPRLHIL